MTLQLWFFWFHISSCKFIWNPYRHKSKIFIDKNYSMTICISNDCLLCFSNKTKKYWLSKNGWQRFKCNTCHHTFSVWWTRWTYDNSFKERVVQNYCHRNQKALEVIGHYWISSRTLIKWSKEHKKECSQCQKGSHK